jgi:hypothetical protein
MKKRIIDLRDEKPLPRIILHQGQMGSLWGLA